jgi:hypothetical protein
MVLDWLLQPPTAWRKRSMVDSALGMVHLTCLTSFDGQRQTVAVSHVGESSLGLASSPPEIRVLALLSSERAKADLVPFNVTASEDADEFNDSFDKGQFDVAVFDASLGAGWPTDAAMALCNRAGRRFPLLLLFDHNNDLVVVESKLTTRDVWCVSKDALQPNELAIIAAGLAVLGHVRTRRPSHN